MHAPTPQNTRVYRTFYMVVSNEKVTRDFKISNSSYNRTSFVLGSTGHDSFCIMIVGSTSTIYRH